MIMQIFEFKEDFTLEIARFLSVDARYMDFSRFYYRVLNGERTPEYHRENILELNISYIYVNLCDTSFAYIVFRILLSL